MRWLNEMSQAFLQRGYLLPGQTAQERLRDIANRAETLLGKK
jgi:ribonucleoside-diphosphate reductase alpha chain